MASTHSVKSTFLFFASCLLAAALVVYTLTLAWLWLRQEKLLFAPEVLAPDYQLVQAADVHELSIDVPGATLSALHLRLPNPKGVVFFLHGNGGSLKNWFVNPAFYRRANYDLFMVDYRGYGKSTGTIESEAQLHADVRAAWATVAAQYAGKKRVVYGRSLGSGLAAKLSAALPQDQTPDLTVLVSPYSSMAAMAGEHYAWVPQALLRYPLRTDQVVGQVRSPLLLIHGAHDALITPSHSETLKALVPQATLLRIAGAAHNDLQDFDEYLSAYARVLANL